MAWHPFSHSFDYNHSFFITINFFPFIWVFFIHTSASYSHKYVEDGNTHSYTRHTISIQIINEKIMIYDGCNINAFENIENILRIEYTLPLHSTVPILALAHNLTHRLRSLGQCRIIDFKSKGFFPSPFALRANTQNCIYLLEALYSKYQHSSLDFNSHHMATTWTSQPSVCSESMMMR